MTKGTFKRVVEVGRVVYVDRGEGEGKLAVIVDIIDHNRALIDCPTTGVPRHSHSYRRLTLTDFVLKEFPRSGGSPIVRKYFEKENILEKWNKTAWAKKLENRKKKSVLTDFDRFKLLKLKKQHRYRVNLEEAKLRKQKA
ncbi:10949_t:CDS:2 [Diversispora eburnea]|uniref:10949_t:CDS:1 n=1 Tax=Diversispora eburnea TaxID=1213867 RepID=A0A9N9F3Y4_9GLOM|nr:10949_t:CDS:2 [Diversispora eburnea]